MCSTSNQGMAPEIQEYYRYLLGEVNVPPGPIVLPEGFSATILARIIHQTLVKKASMMNDVHHVQILYSAWAILNDAYVPIAASTTSTQTDPPPITPRLESCTQTPARAAAREDSAQTVSPPQRAAGCQTALPECRDNVSQTECRSGPGLVSEQAVQTDGPVGVPVEAVSAAVQTEAPRMRTKWTQMRRRVTTASGSQTDRPPTPPPPPPPGCPAETQTPSLDSRASETQTPALLSRTAETQTLLAQALPGRRAAGTQTVPLRPPWALRLVRGALPPPAERPAEPRRFHGRRLLRRGYEAAPPEIPLSAVPGGGDGDGGPPSPAPPADPRLELPRQQCGSEPGGRVGRRRTRTESDTGSICSPVGQTGRRSRSGSSGGEGDPPGPAPAPAVAPVPVPAPAPVNRDPRIRTPSAESVSAAPGLMSHPSPPRLPSLNADDQKVPLIFDSSLTAMLDTSYSFLPAPPPELLGGGGALLRPNTSADRRPSGELSGSDMDLDD